MNLINLTDSYKFSHWTQYPKGTEKIFSYLEARGGEYPSTVFFGLKYYLDEYLSQPITQNDINEAEKLTAFHGVPFNREGWQHILDKGGYIPVEIKAVEEQKLYPIGTVLMTIENTDEQVPWITNWMETLLMKAWYPITVATKSYYVKEIIKGAYEKSSDTDDVGFQYHNFGDRGSSSVESAKIGGMAHLTQFSGTDNFDSVRALKKHYSIEKGWSIPASEHSTVTSWGRENEFNMIESYLESHKGAPIIACVLDSYDIYAAINYVTTELKSKVESADYPVFVIRPDSGNPTEVIDKIFKIMEKNGVSYQTNSKGYKVFDKYRVIWGDGVCPKEIHRILNFVLFKGYSAENIAFGSGGDLMQKVDRDTCKFAIKCSAAKVNGKWRDVFKDPITDQGKKSKAGVLTSPDLKTVYKDGVCTGY